MSTQGRNSRTAVALGILSTIIVAAAIPSLWIRLNGAVVAPASPAAQDEPHRSPIALASSSDGTLFGAGLQTPPSAANWRLPQRQSYTLFGAGLQTPPTPFRGPGRIAGLPPVHKRGG